jgi:hypothetical protein
MICVKLGNSEKPAWWPKFIEYTFRDFDDMKLIERKEWWIAVDNSLKEFGGRLRRNWEGNYFFITFFRESNYAFFVLKFT